VLAVEDRPDIDQMLGRDDMFARLRGIAAAATFAVATATGAASASEVFIQSELTHGFARIQSGVLHADGHADNAVRFELVRLEGNRVAFRAPDGTYLRAGVGQQTLLATGSPHIRGWETFEMVAFGGAHGLRSVQNGKFVEVDRPTGLMSATGSTRATQAMFRFVNAPSAAPPPPQPPRVEWTGRWTQVWLASPNGNLHRPPAGARTDFTISVNREVEMTAGCNTKFANLALRGDRDARFRDQMTTRRNCGDQYQAYEDSFARAMGEVTAYELREGQVAFLDAQGRVLIQIGR
jgi:heat shock protein HslJ